MSGDISTVVFDMDGTLYQIDGSRNGYVGSTLEAQVKQNAYAFIQESESCDAKEVERVFQLATKSEKNGYRTTSQFLADRYNITRANYFERVWNIDPTNIVQKYERALQIVSQVHESGCELVLVTSAPKAWQRVVFTFLELDSYFSQVFTAESFPTGSKREIFEKLAHKRIPNTMISVGDQLETDIVPAQELGYQVLHITSDEDMEKLLHKLAKNSCCHIQ